MKWTGLGGGVDLFGTAMAIVTEVLDYKSQWVDVNLELNLVFQANVLLVSVARGQ